MPRPRLALLLLTSGRILTGGAGAIWVLLTIYQSTLWIITGDFPPLVFAGTNIPMLFLTLCLAGCGLTVTGLILARKEGAPLRQTDRTDKA
ncbi:MAG: hypothetical protein EOM25_02315 [Deltaproteobacteria bacterium]|nr:hypothetical protein [Deltaproteobacteria bacterium]